MAVIYTCDRCGADCSRVAKFVREVANVEWPSDNGARTDDTEDVVVRIEFLRPRHDNDAPDLCSMCIAFVLERLAIKLGQEVES